MIKNMLFFCSIILWVAACNIKKSETVSPGVSHDEIEQMLLEKAGTNASERMHFKLIDSKVQSFDQVLKDINDQLDGYDEQAYSQSFDLVYDKSIPELQKAIMDGRLTYEQLVKWYLYRIKKYEGNPETSLHTIIAINKNAVKEAKLKDQNKTDQTNSIYGMPILLKDNIHAEGMPTTAGSVALKDHAPKDAFITSQLKSKGAIILGKVNLSEWAYYFCDGCPLGYSAIGGQTLNPYGRGIFETGGSSAGSGTSIAANYGAAAVGTETAGSILSPASKNSLVGLKPTVGTLSRTGIVPISSHLDTPGPMTRSVIDNLILLNAMMGKDEEDYLSFERKLIDVETMSNVEKTLTFGINESMLSDLYAAAVDSFRSHKMQMVHFVPDEVSLDGFLTVLNADMKRDMRSYLTKYNSPNGLNDMGDLISFNLQDTTVRMPYGQGRFEAVEADTTDDEKLMDIKESLMGAARKKFDAVFDQGVDVICSINNYEAAHAAAAHYPALTLPMGYTEDGEPVGLTLIVPSQKEEILYQAAYVLEQLLNARKPPEWGRG